MNRVSLWVWVVSVVFAAMAHAEVRLFVEERDGLAWIRYECTAGEVVQAFALDARVDRGAIVGISGFFRGESGPESRGYGVFPASFRDQGAQTSSTNGPWGSTDYSPLAVSADCPEDTLPGLGSGGVTLELGGLWDPRLPEAVPGPAGALCALHLSEAAQVSLAANACRGGVVSASADMIVTTVFEGAFIDPAVRIYGVRVVGGILAIEFQGGELESATSLDGPWVGTGNRTGLFSEPVPAAPALFYRVRRS